MNGTRRIRARRFELYSVIRGYPVSGCLHSPFMAAPGPGTIEFQRTGRTRRYHPDDPCRWTSDTIADILEQDSYLGRTTNFKTAKLSYKSKKKIANPPEKWVVIENTHKAIIDPETWEIVQKAREQRRRLTKIGEMGMFSGLVYCADCGAKLYHCRTASWTHEQERYTCATYRGKKGCSAHYIRAVVLERLALQNLQRAVAYAQEDGFVRRVMENKTAAQRAEQEPADLKQSVENLRAIVNAAEAQAVNVQSFLNIVKKYTEPTELPPRTPAGVCGEGGGSRP